MKKTNFDRYLEEQLKDRAFAQAAGGTFAERPVKNPENITTADQPT